MLRDLPPGIGEFHQCGTRCLDRNSDCLCDDQCEKCDPFHHKRDRTCSPDDGAARAESSVPGMQMDDCRSRCAPNKECIAYEWDEATSTCYHHLSATCHEAGRPGSDLWVKRSDEPEGLMCRRWCVRDPLGLPMALAAEPFRLARVSAGPHLTIAQRNSRRPCESLSGLSTTIRTAPSSVQNNMVATT